jgi:dynactin complex subunit
MLKVKANTMVDDRAMLASANNEIARLKQLLAHALKRGEGIQPSTTSKGNNAQISDVSSDLLEENMVLRQENEQLKAQIAALMERDVSGNKQLSQKVKRKGNSRKIPSVISSHSANMLGKVAAINPMESSVRAGNNGFQQRHLHSSHSDEPSENNPRVRTTITY